MIYYETASTDPRINLAAEDYLLHQAGAEDVLFLWQNAPASSSAATSARRRRSIWIWRGSWASPSSGEIPAAARCIMIWGI